ncbi:MAG: PaaI family thioesterase [Clostridiales bacterium]|nr:PaaI family thioesterase [Clostridiales bacterium]
MSRLDELLVEDLLEKRIRESIDFISKAHDKIDGQLKPKFIDCNAKAGTITLEFPVMDWQLNTNNVMHGGMIATVFDEALGIFAHYFSEGKAALTSNITVHYLKPVPKGDSLLITAKIISAGRKVITLSGEGHLKSNGIMTNSAIASFVIAG